MSLRKVPIRGFGEHMHGWGLLALRRLSCVPIPCGHLWRRGPSMPAVTAVTVVTASRIWVAAFTRQFSAVPAERLRLGAQTLSGWGRTLPPPLRSTASRGRRRFAAGKPAQQAALSLQLLRTLPKVAFSRFRSRRRAQADRLRSKNPLGSSLRRPPAARLSLPGTLRTSLGRSPKVASARARRAVAHITGRLCRALPAPTTGDARCANVHTNRLRTVRAHVQSCRRRGRRGGPGYRAPSARGSGSSAHCGLPRRLRGVGSALRCRRVRARRCRTWISEPSHAAGGGGSGRPAPRCRRARAQRARNGCGTGSAPGQRGCRRGGLGDVLDGETCGDDRAGRRHAGDRHRQDQADEPPAAGVIAACVQPFDNVLALVEDVRPWLSGCNRSGLSILHRIN